MLHSKKSLQRSSLLLATLVATAAWAPAWAQTPPQPADQPRTLPSTARPDGSAVPAKPVTSQSFASQAAVIGKAEVELGQLALKNSQDPSVQKFAQRMISDHTNAAKQLKSVADKQSLALPQTLDPEHQALKAKLTKLKGADFDREYTKAMVDGHEKAVALFESAAQSPQLPADLKQFAAGTLPTLKGHRDMAHSMEGDSDVEHNTHPNTRS